MRVRQIVRERGYVRVNQMVSETVCVTVCETESESETVCVTVCETDITLNWFLMLLLCLELSSDSEPGSGANYGADL